MAEWPAERAAGRLGHRDGSDAEVCTGGRRRARRVVWRQGIGQREPDQPQRVAGLPRAWRREDEGVRPPVGGQALGGGYLIVGAGGILERGHDRRRAKILCCLGRVWRRTRAEGRGDLQPVRLAGHREPGQRPRDDAMPQLTQRKRRQVGAEQDRLVRRVRVQRDQLAPVADAGDAGLGRGGDTRCAGDGLGCARRHPARRVDPHIRADGEGCLVRGRLPPARVSGQRQCGGRRREDDEQHRACLADRPPGDLPAHHRGGEPPFAVGELVGQPGQQRQPAQRDERQPGKRECGGDGDHGIDLERSGRQVRDRRIAAQLPHRDRGERHHGQVAARQGDAREPALPGPAEPGRTRIQGVQRRPGHHGRAQHEHDECGQPGQRGDAAAGIAGQAHAAQAGQHAGQASASQHAHHAGSGGDHHRLGQHGPPQLPPGGATRLQQRGLLLAQTGQQPRGEHQSRAGHQQQLQCGDREQRLRQHARAGYAVQDPRQVRGHLQPLGGGEAELRKRHAGVHGERVEVPAGHRRRLRQHRPRALAHGERPAERGRVHHRGPVADGGRGLALPCGADGVVLVADARAGQQVHHPVRRRRDSWAGTGQ